MGKILLIFTTYFIMMVFGFTETLTGMSIPPIRKEFNVDYSTIGLMVFFASLGYMIACLFAGKGCEKLGEKPILTFGYLLLISSTAIMSFAGHIYIVFILMFLIFAGMGLFETGSNALGSKVFTKNTAVMMNILHLFYGIGAVLGPKFAGVMLLRGFTWKQYYLFLSVIVTVFFISMLLTKFPPKSIAEEHLNISFKQLLSNGSLWLLGIALGFGVTIELGTSNWFVNYLSVEYTMNEDNTSHYLSLFYISLILGRLFGGFIVERVGYLKCIILFTYCTLILYILGAVFRANGAIFISMAGFFIAIVFPTVMSILIKEFNSGTSTIMGFVITLSAIFNMIFNWFIGKTTDIWGVYIGFNSFIIYIVLTIVFFTIYGLHKKYKVVANI